MFPRSYFPMPYVTRPYAVQVGGYVNTGEFSEVGISDIRAQRFDCDVIISWVADPAIVIPNEYFQVYINGQLRWSGDTGEVTIPSPGGHLTINVGHVAPENRDVNYADRLEMPEHPGNRARLTWYGGTWIDADQVGFRIYQSNGPGLPVNMSRSVASIPVAVGGNYGSGFGRGPFGRGPFGRGVVPYSWTSGALSPGRYEFSVAPYDRAGNLPADPPVVTLEIAGPPPAPPVVNGRRLWLESYDPQTGQALIKWNPSI